MTAPTGIAATLVEGTTLHKFTGCGLCQEGAFLLIQVNSRRMYPEAYQLNFAMFQSDIDFNVPIRTVH